MSAPVQPVIVVKKVVKHAGHHGGAWKVAYADFVTAMMAFFLVMWLVGQSKSVKEGIGGYFRDPAVFDSVGGKGVLPGADSIEDPKQQTPLIDAETDMRRLEAAVEHIKETLNNTPAFQTLKDQVEFTVMPEGLRIDLIEKDASSFFASGSAVLRPETEKLLAIIAKELGALQHEVVIEGHTDSQAYSAANKYSNWELSADRANAARRVMDQNGLRSNQVVSVRGLADRQLKIPENPLDARNRRVSILVQSPLIKMDGKPDGKSAATPSGSGASPTAATESAEHVAAAVKEAIAGAAPAAH
jgi:chemotaxis protein MotB